MNGLQRQLDASLAFPPEYGDGLSTHLPMALHALHELGACDARLTGFAQRYSARFGDRRAVAVAPLAGDWRAARGEFEAFDALRATFAAQIAAQGRDAALRTSLPDLWPGLAAAAFHGLIRTAHAVQSGHDGELAAALAYWAARWQPVPAPVAAAAQPLDDWWAALQAEALRARPQGRLISERIEAVAEGEAYGRLAGALAVDGETPAGLWRHAADLYDRSGNFTVLHVVTGCRAIHVLAPWLASVDSAWSAAVPALTAAVLASDLKLAPPLSPRPPVDWESAVQRAMASDDEHVIKLVHAARQGEREVAGAEFLHAAARAAAQRG